MAVSIGGFGTSYYGHRPMPDGTYIVTEWIVVAFLPIYPLGSFRVVGAERAESIWPGYSQQSLRMQPVPLNRRHLIIGYFVTLIAVALVTWAIVSNFTLAQ